MEKERKLTPRQAFFLSYAYATGLGVEVNHGKINKFYKMVADTSQHEKIYYPFKVTWETREEPGREKVAEQKDAEAYWALYQFWNSAFLSQDYLSLKNDYDRLSYGQCRIRTSQSLRRAADLGHTQALFLQAHESDENWKDYLIQAAEKNYIPAIEILILLYTNMPLPKPFDGYYFREARINPEKEQYYINKLIKLDSPIGNYALGKIYYEKHNLKNLRKWDVFDREIKDEEDKKASQEKEDKVIEYWKLAAEKKYVPAFAKLSEFYQAKAANSKDIKDIQYYNAQRDFFAFAGYLLVNQFDEFDPYYNEDIVYGAIRSNTLDPDNIYRDFFRFEGIWSEIGFCLLENLQTLLAEQPQKFLQYFTISIDSPYPWVKSVICSITHQIFNSPPTNKFQADILKKIEKKPETQQIRKQLAGYFLEQNDLPSAMIHLLRFELTDFSVEERALLGARFCHAGFREFAYDYLKSVVEDKSAPAETRLEAKNLLIFSAFEEVKIIVDEKGMKSNPMNHLLYRDNKALIFPEKFSEWVKYFSHEEPAYQHLKKILENKAAKNEAQENKALEHKLPEGERKSHAKTILMSWAGKALKIKIPAAAEQKALALPPTYFEFLDQIKKMYAPKKEEKKEKENEAKSPAHSPGLFSAPCILIKTEAEINAANGVIFQQIQTELYQGIAKAGGMELKNDDSVRVFLHDLMELVPSPNSLGFDLEAVEYKSVRTEVLHKIALEVKNKLLSPTYNDRALRTALETIFKILKMNGRCPDGLEAAEAQQKRPG